jgi:hypothetical protein
MARTAADRKARQDAGGPTAAEIVLADAVLAGAAGLAVWEACARLAAPLILGAALEPSAFLARTLGVDLPAAVALHVLAGGLVMPLAYVLVLRRLLPGATPWWMAGPGLGLVVWAVAILGIGRLGAGAVFPAMGTHGVVVLLAHLAMGLAVAAVVQWRGAVRRPAPELPCDRGRSVR